MDLEPLLWIIFFLMNMGLIALNLYQIVNLSDLEADYLNPYESSSRINHVVIPEYLLHGAFSILFLLSGHWFFFLATLPAAYINLRKFMKREHLIDVTEVFRVLSVEKKLRVVKLGFYLLLFVLVMTRIYAAGTFSVVISVFHSDNEELDIRSSILEF